MPDMRMGSRMTHPAMALISTFLTNSALVGLSTKSSAVHSFWYKPQQHLCLCSWWWIVMLMSSDRWHSATWGRVAPFVLHTSNMRHQLLFLNLPTDLFSHSAKCRCHFSHCSLWNTSESTKASFLLHAKAKSTGPAHHLLICNPSLHIYAHSVTKDHFLFKYLN